MSWWRASVFGVIIVAVAFGTLVYVPDLIVSSLTGVGRSTRVALATTWFTVALFALLCALRKLQSHGWMG